MKFLQLVKTLLLTSAIAALLTTRALSQEKSSIGVNLSPASTDSALSTQKTPLDTKAQHVKPITEIQRLSEISCCAFNLYIERGQDARTTIILRFPLVQSSCASA